MLICTLHFSNIDNILNKHCQFIVYLVRNLLTPFLHRRSQTQILHNAIHTLLEMVLGIDISNEKNPNVSQCTLYIT